MDTRMIASGAKGYPFLLQKIYDPPKILYYKGELPNENKPLLAVVGSRKMTEYGKAVVQKILPPVIRAGVGIVSGLAYGIDTEALTCALEYGGKAYGVIGSGLDEKSFYPKQNISLAKRMVLSGGAVISEYNKGTPALPKHFAIRNRIVAGMCHGALIIEAAKKSGSLITAEVALNENREVFAPPNTIFHIGSAGTNELLKNGAHLITSGDDIISILGIDLVQNMQESSSKIDDAIVTILKDKPMHIDAIAKTLDLTAKNVSATLSKLEIKGVVINIGGTNYIKK